MKSSLFGGMLFGPSNATGGYISVQAGPSPNSGWQANRTDGAVEIPMPGAYDLSNLRVVLNVAPGASRSWTFNVLKNGSVALSASISGTNTTATASGALDVAQYADGDLICVQMVPTNTPTGAGAVWWSMDCMGDGQPIFGGTWTGTSNTAVRYNAPMGVGGNGTQGNWLASNATTRGRVPIAGTASNLHVQMYAGDAGGSGKAYALSLERTDGGGSGSTTQNLTTTVSGSLTSATNTNSFSINAHDTLTMRCAPSGTPTVRAIAYSWVWTPTTAWQSIVMGSLAGAPNNGPASNVIMGQGRNSWSSSAEVTNSSVFPVSPPVTFKTISVLVQTTPASGKTHDYVFRKNATNTALSGSVVNGSLSASGVADVPVSGGDYVTLGFMSTTTPGFPGGHAVGFSYQNGQQEYVTAGVAATGSSSVDMKASLIFNAAAAAQGEASVSIKPQVFTTEEITTSPNCVVATAVVPAPALHMCATARPGCVVATAVVPSPGKCQSTFTQPATVVATAVVPAPERFGAGAFSSIFPKPVIAEALVHHPGRQRKISLFIMGDSLAAFDMAGNGRTFTDVPVILNTGAGSVPGAGNTPGSGFAFISIAAALFPNFLGGTLFPQIAEFSRLPRGMTTTTVPTPAGAFGAPTTPGINGGPMLLGNPLQCTQGISPKGALLEGLEAMGYSRTKINRYDFAIAGSTAFLGSLVGDLMAGIPDDNNTLQPTASHWTQLDPGELNNETSMTSYYRAPSGKKAWELIRDAERPIVVLNLGNNDLIAMGQQGSPGAPLLVPFQNESNGNVFNSAVAQIPTSEEGIEANAQRWADSPFISPTTNETTTIPLSIADALQRICEYFWRLNPRCEVHLTTPPIFPYDDPELTGEFGPDLIAHTSRVNDHYGQDYYGLISAVTIGTPPFSTQVLKFWSNQTVDNQSNTAPQLDAAYSAPNYNFSTIPSPRFFPGNQNAAQTPGWIKIWGAANGRFSATANTVGDQDWNQWAAHFYCDHLIGRNVPGANYRATWTQGPNAFSGTNISLYSPISHQSFLSYNTGTDDWYAVKNNLVTNNYTRYLYPDAYIGYQTRYWTNDIINSIFVKVNDTWLDELESRFADRGHYFSTLRQCRHAIPVGDGMGTYYKSGSKHYFVDDVHMNDIGARHWAGAIARELVLTSPSFDEIGVNTLATPNPVYAVASVQAPQVTINNTRHPGTVVATAVVPQPRLSVVTSVKPEMVEAEAIVPDPLTSVAVPVYTGTVVATAVVPSPAKVTFELKVATPNTVVATAIIGGPIKVSASQTPAWVNPVLVEAVVPQPLIAYTIVPSAVIAEAVVPVPLADSLTLEIVQPETVVATAFIVRPLIRRRSIPTTIRGYEITAGDINIEALRSTFARFSKPQFSTEVEEVARYGTPTSEVLITAGGGAEEQRPDPALHTRVSYEVEEELRSDPNRGGRWS